MSVNIDQIAEAFYGYRFGVTYPYMADEIKCNIVGREELAGQESMDVSDVLQFSDGRPVEITSCVIELNKPSLRSRLLLMTRNRRPGIIHVPATLDGHIRRAEVVQVLLASCEPCGDLLSQLIKV